MPSTNYEIYENIVRNSLIMRSFPKSIQDKAINESSWLTCKRGKILFTQEDVSHGIHVIGEGWVKLFYIAPNGDEAVVSVLTKGESFGEAVAFRGLTYPVSAQTVTNSVVLHIPRKIIIEAIHKDPEIAVNMMASVFSHLHSLVFQVQQLKLHTGAQRVADFLLELCGKESGSCSVTLPYDKILIAGRLGMKPESLSRSFSRLKSLGVKIEGNKATISNISLLRRYTDCQSDEFWDEIHGKT